MLDRKQKEKQRKKRAFVISRLQELGKFPLNLEELTEQQQNYYNQIKENDFTYWEEVKIEYGWKNHEKKTPEERKLSERKKYIRDYFRSKGVLPKYGDPLNEEQQKLLDQIEAGDFSYHTEYVNNPANKATVNSSNLSSRKKRERVRSQLRKYGYLPAVGEPLTEEQQEIMNQIDRDDFSYYNNLEKEAKVSSVVENSKPKMVLHRLRLVEILPPFGEPLTEEQQAIIDDVHENWEGKNKNYFITKYLHLSTPEGRLYYRLYKANRDFGYNFNLEISDIVIPEYCPYLGIKLSTDPKDKDNDNYYTGDRKDSSKGYVKGNVQVVSLKANRMKHKATQEQLLKFAVNGLTIIAQMEENAKREISET